MIVDTRDCSWSAANGRLAGGYLFAVQRDGDATRIAYLPAYFRDCGWSGAQCLLRGPGCAAHAGDSEIIIADVRRDAESGRWVSTGIFLSAHCFGRSDGRCRWYRGDALRELSGVDGARFAAPRVWVARGKHANYPSRSACDSGHWVQDTCDRNTTSYRFPIVSARQNIGSRAFPAMPDGCLDAAALPLGDDTRTATGRECIWSNTGAFRGWQRESSGNPASPYGRYLTEIARF